MKTQLNFEDKNTKELLANLDFNFFLEENIEEENYRQGDIDILYSSYENSLRIKS